MLWRRGPGGPQTVDWEAIERSPDFQELGRRQAALRLDRGTIGIGLGALYVVLAGVAPDLMGTKLFGDMSLGFAGGVGLILLTWAITLAYMLPLRPRLGAARGAHPRSSSRGR